MLRVFQDDLQDAEKFVITLELVPGREAGGRSAGSVMALARAAFEDGRISAVSITDNPGGNPSLSPDVIGSEIFKVGMDVIVHFTCRDTNRVGMESRALQLAHMGMKNILALTGDYTGKGFGGQGAPVFDLDSVQLLSMLNRLSDRLDAAGDPDGFYTGCAVSPFKYTEAESFAQYAKWCRKCAGGARFAITQLGYDLRKFEELARMQRLLNLDVPVLGSVYVLTPGAARVMHAGQVPGARVSAPLLEKVQTEWRQKEEGRRKAIERAARLAVVVKGLGYRGIHIGGVHRRFDTVARLLDRMADIEDRWESFLPEFKKRTPPEGFFAFSETRKRRYVTRYGKYPTRPPLTERIHFKCMDAVHSWFFTDRSILAAPCRWTARWLDRSPRRRRAFHLFEAANKMALLACRQCGDCGIQHLAYLCPESQCPKHTRNGACGGSRDGSCEVVPDRRCVWYRAYGRWSWNGRRAEMVTGCVPPRMWELERTPSWLNFHLGRDHHSATDGLSTMCRTSECRLPQLP
jgi:methylenetetrahydrofolate reductase (NADPH)